MLELLWLMKYKTCFDKETWCKFGSDMKINFQFCSLVTF